MWLKVLSGALAGSHSPGSLNSEPLVRPFLKLPGVSFPSTQGLGAKPLIPGGLTPWVGGE